MDGKIDSSQSGQYIEQNGFDAVEKSRLDLNADRCLLGRDYG